jgi:ketosteroid isomerase-like protein
MTSKTGFLSRTKNHLGLGILAVCLLAGLTSMGAVWGSNTRTLEQRLAQVEAQIEIRDLIVNYGLALDRLDFDMYSNLFAKDGTWNGSTSNFTDLKGPEVIRETMLKAFAGQTYDVKHPNMLHIVSNMKIQVDGDTASGYSKYTVLFRDKEDDPYVAIVGHYDDTYVREDGHWKFKTRVSRRYMDWGSDTGTR